jgi:hypothetical protein
MAAELIDSVVAIALTSPVTVSAITRHRRANQGMLPPAPALGTRIGAAAIVFGYELVSRACWGRTLGERAAGVTVVASGGASSVIKGGTISWSAAGKLAAVRVVPAIIPALGTVLYAADTFSPMWDRDRRAVSDRVTGTVVIDA